MMRDTVSCSMQWNSNITKWIQCYWIHSKCWSAILR